MTLSDLEQLIAELQEPAYRAQQIYRWVHQRGVTEWSEMRNVPKALLSTLVANASLSRLTVDATQTSEDGTHKLRLRCADGAAIESVLIPRDDKLTQCLSTQVGCGLGCRFCATATMGHGRNLTPGEIVDQVYRAQAFLGANGGSQTRITNLVFMGMGEPMANLENVFTALEILCSEDGANFSPRRITVSTVGLIPGIIEFGRRAKNVGLAISLHATTNELRDRLIPINKKWPIETLMQTLRDYPLPRRRRITFEYIVLRGLNDTDADIQRLAKLIANIPSKVNLLPYNPTRPDQPDLLRPDPEAVEIFAEKLRDKGLNVTVRHSRGLDIAAACGQLALKTAA